MKGGVKNLNQCREEKEHSLNDSELNSIFENIFRSRNSSAYKFIFMESIFQAIKFKDENDNITFEQIYKVFTSIVWEWYVKHDIRLKSKSKTRAELVIDEFLEKNQVNHSNFEQLNKEKKDILINKIISNCTEYVIDAILENSNKTLYDVNYKTRILVMNPVLLQYMKNNLSCLRKTNFLYAQDYILKCNPDKQEKVLNVIKVDKEVRKLSEIGKCLLQELRKLKESSKEAVEGLGTLSKFKEYMHVERDVQFELESLIEKVRKNLKPQLILVCGGVGDGKSHLISYLKNKHSDLLDGIKIHNDATESFIPKGTSIDTLNQELNEFADENLENGKNAKCILAINLGALNNFIDSEYQDRYTKLKQYVLEKAILEERIIENTYNEDSYFQFINFSDYHMYTLTENGGRSQYIEQLLQKITAKDSNNTFYKTYENHCSKCAVNSQCPVKANYEFLSQSAAQKVLINLLVEGMVKDRLIISTRALLNFFYDILVSPIMDHTPYHDVQQMIDKMEPEEGMQHYIPNLIFEHPERSPILDVLSKLDPIHYRSEALDNILIKLNTIVDVTPVYEEYIHTDLFLVAKQLLANENYCSLSDDKQKEYRANIVKFMVQLYRFIPKKELVSFEDELYHQYMKYLYFWNRQIKKPLSQLYKDIKEAIYKWNGERRDDKHINLFIGQKQLQFKTSQKLELTGDVTDLVDTGQIELYRFIPYLIVKFKKEEGNISYPVAIDYSLFVLLTQIKNGYRPNIKDKYKYIQFVEFMDKIMLLGEQKKELTFESLDGQEPKVYKLTFDDQFEEYKFTVVSS